MGSGKCVVISVLLVFDVVAFNLAVAAERRSKGTLQVDATQNITWCKYDLDKATGLGVGAFLFLLASQSLVGVVTRCLCCKSKMKPGGTRIFTAILFSLSWVFFLITEIFLIAGSTRNAKHYNIRGYFGAKDVSCEGLRKGTFAAGAAFSLITMFVSMAYYLLYSKANEESWKTYRAEPGVGLTSFR